MDPGVLKLLERTKARRTELKECVTLDGSPLPSERDRSPLKERTNIKTNSSPTKSKMINSGVDLIDSPSDTVKRLLSRDNDENNVQELINRQSPGKMGSRTVSTRTSPGKGVTTFTKTVITEKEEKYEKKQIISVSGNKKDFLDNINMIENVDKELFSKELDLKDRSTFMGNKENADIPIYQPQISKDPINEDPLKSNPPYNNSPETTPSMSLKVKDDYLSSRKERLLDLANKFKNLDEESPLKFPDHIQFPKQPTKPTPRIPSPTKHAPIKTDYIRTNRSPSPVKNPNQFITKNERTGSPTKAPSAPIPSESSFVTKLKAQGFQESESKTKLTYEFDNKRSTSPVKGNIFVTRDQEQVDERSNSPVRGNIFVQQDRVRPSGSSPQKGERGRSSVKKTLSSSSNKTLNKDDNEVRESSPIDSPSKVNSRSHSPDKPHPMHFITPQTGPPKPSRTYETTLHPHKAESRLIPADKERVDSPVMKSVSLKRDMFEKQVTNNTPEPEYPDPALMSISDRMALFDKKGSAVPTPIARFGEAVTPAMLEKGRTDETNQSSDLWRRKRAQSPSKSIRQPSPIKQSVRQPSPVRQTERQPSPVRLSVRQPSPVRQPDRQLSPVRQTEICNTPNLGRKTEEMQRKLFKEKDWKDNSIAQKAYQEKQAEMELLMNRYNHLREKASGGQETPKVTKRQVDDDGTPPPPPPPPPAQTDKYYPGVSSMKRVKMSPPKAGGMYPNIDFSDSDRPESGMSTDTHSSSFESVPTHFASEAPTLGKDIAKMTRREEQEHLPSIEDNNDSVDTEEGEGLTDSMLDIEMDDENVDDYPTPPKVTKMSSSSDHMDRSDSTSSWEFHTPQVTKTKVDDKFRTPLICTTSDSPVGPQPTIEGDEGPLQHTVSFYRKQKPVSVTPVQKIMLTGPNLDSGSREVLQSPRATITQRIHQLQEEANNQMPVIQQSSSALNLCRSTKEFFGSSEQVEGERLLLVASHKRAVALTEIGRLKTEGGIGADPRKEVQSNNVRGTVSLSGVSLDLKKEYADQLQNGDSDDFVHYFICLVKCSGQVVPTQMVSTCDGLEGNKLHFPNLINFRDLTKDFNIQLEVFALQTRREVIAHEEKYHIKRTVKSAFALTPKKKYESRLTRPDMSSPGGPHTVRTSSFAIVGQTVVTIHSLHKKNWRLESVPPISPLDGNLTFKLNCHSESQVSKRSFLTMFDDVSGFGAWHRRWFVLTGNTISFWKYPENESNMDPIGRLDLGQCVTSGVSLCPRDICSRLNTFMLETSRPAIREDRESLVVVRQGKTTVLRHLLSADSRQERVEWCHIINQALDNLRAWDIMRPMSGSESSQGSTDI